MTKLRLLLVDDDAEFLRHFVFLGEDLFEIETACSGAEGLRRVETTDPDAVLLDIDLGKPPDGLEVLERIRRIRPDLPVIMVSGDENPETVVHAMRLGANDYVTKRPNLEVLNLKVQRALEQTAWRLHAREMQQAEAGRLIGSSRVMQHLREEIGRVGPMKVRVLIEGETGTGKELVARALHAASPRSRERLVVISGAVGTDTLFDSEVFGHEKGAFTGADQRRHGRFELASGGTLFFDEIDKMPRDRQAKLLRAIETGRFERVGGKREIDADVRLLSATNQDLEKKIEEGDFHEDFFFRLNEYRLSVPPLRDRLEDLPEVTKHLLDRFCRSERLPPVELTPDAIDPLTDYSWPGNVRELDTVLKRAVILSPTSTLDADAMRDALAGQRHSPEFAHRSTSPKPLPGPQTTLSAFLCATYTEDREHLMAVFDRLYFTRELEKGGGNATRAAERLGISRAGFYRRLNELSIETRDSR